MAIARARAGSSDEVFWQRPVAVVEGPDEGSEWSSIEDTVLT